jgi:hypothetical protein
MIVQQSGRRQQRPIAAQNNSQIRIRRCLSF